MKNFYKARHMSAFIVMRQIDRPHFIKSGGGTELGYFPASMCQRPVDGRFLLPDGHGTERDLRRDEDRQLLPR